MFHNIKLNVIKKDIEMDKAIESGKLLNSVPIHHTERTVAHLREYSSRSPIVIPPSQPRTLLQCF